MPQDPPRRGGAPEPRGRPAEPRQRNRNDSRHDDVDEPEEEGRLDELQARWRRYGLAEGMRARAEPKPARKPAPPPPKKRAEERTPGPREGSTRAASPRPLPPASTPAAPDTAVLRELIRRLAEIERTAAGRVDALEEASDTVVRAVEEKARAVQARLETAGDEQAERLSGLVTQVGDLQHQVASLQRALIDSATGSGESSEATEAARAALQSLTTEQQELAARVAGERGELETAAAGAKAQLETVAVGLKADLEALTRDVRTDVEALRDRARLDLETLGSEMRTAQTRALEEINASHARLERVSGEQSARLDRLLERIAAAEKALTAARAADAARRVESVAQGDAPPSTASTIEIEGLLERVSQAERETAVRIAELEQAGAAHTRALDDRIGVVLEQLDEKARAARDDVTTTAESAHAELAAARAALDQVAQSTRADVTASAESARAELAGASAAARAALDERVTRGAAEIDETAKATRDGLSGDLAAMRAESEAMVTDMRSQRTRLLETAASARADLDQLGMEQLARLGELVQRVAATEQAAAQHAESLESSVQTRLAEVEERIRAAGERNTDQVEQVATRQREALVAIVTDQTGALEAAAKKLEETLQGILVTKVTEFDRTATDAREDLERASAQHASRVEEALERLNAAEVRATEVGADLVRTGASQSRSLDEQTSALAARFEQTASEHLERLQRLIDTAAEVAAEAPSMLPVPAPALDVESVERATEFATGGALDELIATRIVEVEQIAAAQMRALEEAGAAQNRSLAQTAAAASSAQAQAFEQAAAAALATQAGVIEQAATATSLTQTRMLESTAASARTELERLAEAQYAELQELAVWIEEHERAAMARMTEMETRGRQIHDTTDERLQELERVGQERTQLLRELTARVEVIERAAADKIAELQALVGVARLEDRRGGESGRGDAAGTDPRAGDRGDVSGRSERS